MSIPLYLPKTPRQTTSVDFNECFIVTKKHPEADELLRLLTSSRKRTNDVLLKYPANSSNMDPMELVNEYVALVVGFVDAPAPKAEAPQAEASTSEAKPAPPAAEEEKKEEKKEDKKEEKKDKKKKDEKKDEPVPLNRAIAYSWTEFSRKAKAIGYGGPDFDINSTLLNLGIWYLVLGKELLAIQDKSSTDKNQREAYKYLSKAAGVFKFVSEKTPNEKGDLSDLRPNVSKALVDLALAEAQLITVARAEAAKHSPALIASLARGAAEKFQAVKDTLLSPNPTPVPDVDDSWVAYLEAKKEATFAKAYFYHGTHFALPDATSSGKAVKAFETAVEHLKKAQAEHEKYLTLFPEGRSHGGKSYLEDCLKEYEERHRKAKKENDMVYFEKLPEAPETLPEPKVSVEVIEYTFPAKKDVWTDEMYAVLKAKRDALSEVEKDRASSGCCIVM